MSLARRAHSLPPHQALARTAAQERSALEVLLRVIAATKGTTRRRSPRAVVFAPPAATLRPELGVAQPAQQESSVARLPAVAPHVRQENSALSSPTIRARQAAVIVLRGRSVKTIRQNAQGAANQEPMERLAPLYVYLVWLEAIQEVELTAARIVKKASLVKRELRRAPTAQQGSTRARLRQPATTVSLLTVT